LLPIKLENEGGVDLSRFRVLCLSTGDARPRDLFRQKDDTPNNCLGRNLYHYPIDRLCVLAAGERSEELALPQTT
jgi:hypothetical protein